MFENSADKIKIVSVVLFWITVVVSVILAFVLGWDREYIDADFRPQYFFTFLIGVPVASYVLTLFLDAFADLVQNSERIKEATQSMAKSTTPQTDCLERLAGTKLKTIKED